jgi:hypothetical protein
LSQDIRNFRVLIFDSVEHRPREASWCAVQKEVSGGLETTRCAT